MNGSGIKQFLLRLFAALGVVLACVALFGFFTIKSLFSPPRTPPAPPESMVLELDFTKPILEKPEEFGFSLSKLLDEETEATPLRSIVLALERAKDDPRVKGVVARFSTTAAPNLVQAQEIAAALKAFRASGKPTYSFATSYGSFSPGGSLYYLASQFENIWLQPIGSVGLTGLGLEAPFGKTALKNIGIEADVQRRAEYKSALENVAGDSFSPPVRENMRFLLESVYDQLAAGLAESRKIDVAKAKEIMAAGPYTAKEALAAGLVGKLGYEDEMDKEAEGKFGKKAERVAPEDYIDFPPAEKKVETAPLPHVALIYLEGPIVEDAPKGAYKAAQDDVIDGQATAQAIREATEDKEVKALLLRIDSPGGSPVASETIRRAILKAKEGKKPVVVSMGRVAASGGYWISMDADRIIADPATITGSIGVISGKFVFRDLFEKLGIKWDRLATDDSASLWSILEPFGPKGEARMNAMLDETYKAFTDNVAAARKIPLEKMPEIAKGRVFTGEQALKVGLVDELGGFSVALAAVKKSLNMDPKAKVTLERFPEPETPETLALKAFKRWRSGKGGIELDGLLPASLQARLKPFWQELLVQDPVRASLPAVFVGQGW